MPLPQPPATPAEVIESALLAALSALAEATRASTHGHPPPYVDDADPEHVVLDGTFDLRAVAGHIARELATMPADRGAAA